MSIDLGKLIHEWFKGRLDERRFHIIGHSLGTFVSATAGRSFFNETGKTKKLRRITGLDPAERSSKSSLNVSEIIPVLNAEDAEYVDIHHTDSSASSTISVGVNRSLGTVDIWYNDPEEFQPGCRGATAFEGSHCSHLRAIEYYADMVTGPFRFFARKSDSWNTFTQNENQCDVLTLGPKTSLNSKGDYFIQTNPSRPFSRGFAGILYRNIGQ